MLKTIRNLKAKKEPHGFTLIELLIVIAIIAVLAGISFIALNPMARLQDSRNAKRWSDVDAILGAIKLDQVDNGGDYIQSVMDMADNTYYQIGTAASGCNTPCTNPSVTLQSACVDLLDLIDQGYLPDVPDDPNYDGTAQEMTDYYIYKYNSGQIMVGACNEEQGTASAVEPIEVAR